MDHTINVLDHGLVRLVSYMQPAVQAAPVTRYDETRSDMLADRGEKVSADYSDWNGDLEIVRNARVSYAAAARAGEDEHSDSRLINYLLKNHHTSPFEAMTFTFEVKAPIFTIRQWHRHRIGWSYNELSGRYRELPEEFYVPELDQITTQSTSNKQMRTDEQHPDAALYQQTMRHMGEDAFALYKEMLRAGVPRELARTVLPLSTYTHMFTTCSLLALFHFCGLRMHAHAQYEIRVYAEAMLKLVEPICPAAVKAFRLHVLKEAPVEVIVENNTGGTVVIGVAKGIRKHF